jgi:hypothetical protein
LRIAVKKLMGVFLKKPFNESEVIKNRAEGKFNGNSA